MIRGETVAVQLLTDNGYSTPADVANVVIDPYTYDEMDETRPDGITSSFTLHFPRGYSGDLRGALVTVRGKEYRVVGDPQPYTEANVPGSWTMPVKVVRHDG